ncbi:hypothetical protein L1765_01095 [Microaerobacter geothermalis]|uniref:hypothetical protein n=1 Tax=Microaerobacter geothermalis TaxID=674972 RepID=UPI001F37A00F|nr:hypothetical protein [Microaerobacter geothermalis]MCF6092589.1 hypothetical protein [Microaerobacter geothermalis]
MRYFLILTALFLTIASFSPVFADGGGEEADMDAVLLTKQAIAFLLSEQYSETDRAMYAMEKVKDALEDDEQEGVNLDALKKALTLLQEENNEEAKKILYEALINPSDRNSFVEPVEKKFKGTSQEYSFLAAAGISILLGGFILRRKNE